MVIKCQSRHSTLSSLTSEPMHLAITAFFSQKCLGCCSSTIWGRGGNVSFLKKFKTSPLTYITFLPIFWIYVFHSFLWLHLPLRDLALILAGVQIPRTFNWTWLKKKENQLCVNQFSLVNQDWPDTAGRNTYLGRFRREDVPETSMGTSPSHGHLRRKGGRTGVKTCRSSVLCCNGGGPFKGTPQAKSSAHEKKKEIQEIWGTSRKRHYVLCTATQSSLTKCTRPRARVPDEQLLSLKLYLHMTSSGHPASFEEFGSTPKFLGSKWLIKLLLMGIICGGETSLE